jgi:uncharacterized protein
MASFELPGRPQGLAGSARSRPAGLTPVAQDTGPGCPHRPRPVSRDASRLCQQLRGRRPCQPRQHTARAGVGLKPQHWAILGGAPGRRLLRGPCRELHGRRRPAAPDAGGAPRALAAVAARRRAVDRRRAGPLDRDHLARLRRWSTASSPASFSEHLAWSTHGGVFFNDLLPLPYTMETLAPRRRPRRPRCRSTCSAAGCCWRTPPPTSPSRAARWTRSRSCARSPAHRLRPAARREQRAGLGDQPGLRGGGLSRRLPLHQVGEIHLAGHARDRDDAGGPLLIDAHDRAVGDEVWALYGAPSWRGPASCPTSSSGTTTSPAGRRCSPKRGSPKASWPPRPGRRRAVPPLAELQAGFAAALMDPARPAPEGLRQPAGRRFDVHRNNMTVALIAALETAFPGGPPPGRRRLLQGRCQGLPAARTAALAGAAALRRGFRRFPRRLRGGGGASPTSATSPGSNGRG